MSEDDWESCDEIDDAVSESGSVGSLYAGHEIKEEIVIGPVEIRKPVYNLKFKASKTESMEPEKEIEERKPQYSCKSCEEATDHKHYSCAHCDAQFWQRLGIIGHLKKHRRPKNICEICQKEFLYPHKLQKHMANHSNDRPFSCDICKKAFKRKMTLSAHKNTHEKRKQHKCEQCPKYFTTKGQLQTHTRLHTGEKPYACKKCSKNFSQQTSLNNHLLTHTGIKPHQCEFCKQRFRQVSNLKTHLATKHTPKNEKVRKYPNKKVQKRDTKNVERGVSLVWFSCKTCKVFFSSSNDLSKHKKLSHG